MAIPLLWLQQMKKKEDGERWKERWKVERKEGKKGRKEEKERRKERERKKENAELVSINFGVV